MTVFTSNNTGLQSYGYALTPESSHYLGDDKYLCICSVYGTGIGCVVIKAKNGIVTEAGTPSVLTSIGYTGGNPLAMWCGTNGIILNCDGYTVGGKCRWIIFTVSGLSVVEVSHGELSNNMSFIYGCHYNIISEGAVVCYNYSDTKRFLTFKITGGSVVNETAAAETSSGYVIRSNVRISNCGDYCILCFTKNTYPYIPEFRVASNIGSSAFSVTNGYTPFATGAYFGLGLSGDDNGNFLYHCIGTYVYGHPEITYKNPCYVAGKIISGVPVFGQIFEYEPDGIISRYLVGSIENINTGDYASASIAYSPYKIYVHRVNVENLDVTGISKEASISVNLSGNDYDHLSISTKKDGGCCIFYTDNTTKKIFVITSKFYIEIPLFWTNRTIHTEKESGLIEKKQTKTVIAGNVGQPYVPYRPAIPSIFASYEYNFAKECKKIE